MPDIALETKLMFAAILIGLVFLPFAGMVFDQMYKRWGPLYRHKKTGRVYRLLDIAVDEKTQNELVVYRSIEDGIIWVRNHHEFFDGRFEKIPR
jgi:hypothetical protein